MEKKYAFEIPTAQGRMRRTTFPRAYQNALGVCDAYLIRAGSDRLEVYVDFLRS